MASRTAGTVGGLPGAAVISERGARLAAIPDRAVEHGEVFTRRWIVDLILDLVGYEPGRDLARLVAVEPAGGTGAFLGPMVARLSASCRRHGRSLSDASRAIDAYDLLTRNVEASRRLVEKVLIDDGWPTEEAVTAAETWVRRGDYLLTARRPCSVDVVVGNPPYIRLEDVPADRMAAYRAA